MKKKQQRQRPNQKVRRKSANTKQKALDRTGYSRAVAMGLLSSQLFTNTDEPAQG